MEQQAVSNCEFCTLPMEDTTSYNLLAWQAAADQADGPGLAFQMCRQCFYSVCRHIVDHREHILALQSGVLKQKAAAYGIKV
jgi:hypothetical protein